MYTVPTLEELLSAGVHFGHKTSKWHPKMEPYIFTVRSGVHIFDLEKTRAALERVLPIVRQMAAEGKTMLFVGVKKQTAEIVREAAVRVNQPYVVNRWLGGTLTNFGIIQKMIKHLEKLEEQAASGALKKYTKKEQLVFEQERKRLEQLIGGIRSLKKVPDCIFIVGLRESKTVIHEAQRKNVPIVAVCDTNDNPDEVTYMIPANDDAVRSIRMMVTAVTDAFGDGKEAHTPSVNPKHTAPSVHEEETDVHDLRLKQELTKDLEKLDEQTAKEQHEQKLRIPGV